VFKPEIFKSDPGFVFSVKIYLKKHVSYTFLSLFHSDTGLARISKFQKSGDPAFWTTSHTVNRSMASKPMIITKDKKKFNFFRLNSKKNQLSEKNQSQTGFFYGQILSLVHGKSHAERSLTSIFVR
jgi:hypothetical protein